MSRTQYAVQLVASDDLKLNTSKEVAEPGPRQILAKVEAVGLCFSDLKVLKQFGEHPRKREVIGGLAQEILAGIPSYVPGDKPTVPGHEVVCRVIAVGEGVTTVKPGDRCMVQPDFRPLPTPESNAAFGYNFEGGLQEYLLLDERVMIDPEGERFLIAVEDHLGASQAALVEPWACVEDSYVTPERQRIKPGGTLLVAAEEGHAVEGLEESFDPAGKSTRVLHHVASPEQRAAVEALGLPLEEVADLSSLPKESIDDIVYFGGRRETLETLNDKLAAHGIVNIVLDGRHIGSKVSIGVGKMHYFYTRWIGTTGRNAAESYKVIPPTGEVRDGDRIVVMGAGGPMGQMHVVRNICSGKQGLSVLGTDFDQGRLDALMKKAGPIAEAHGVSLGVVNAKNEKLNPGHTYFALMAPVGALVEEAIALAAPGAVVNIFAGIPIHNKHEIDLDTLIEKRMFVYGTSGSTIQDMKIVLGKVTAGQLDTDASVDAISGMAGAIDGIRAVEHRTMAGKIIVYPSLHNVGLIPLERLGDYFPTVAAKLDNGKWCKAAEEELLRAAGES